MGASGFSWFLGSKGSAATGSELGAGMWGARGSSPAGEQRSSGRWGKKGGKGVLQMGKPGAGETPDFFLGGGGKWSSLPTEDILGVARPDLVFALVGAAREGAGARGAASHHVEARFGQLVESLLQEIKLEIIARRVTLGGPVGISALVQGIPENLLRQGRLAAHGDARHSPEFGIGLRVAPDGVGTPVADGDVARAPATVQRLGRREQGDPRRTPRRAPARQLQRGRRHPDRRALGGFGFGGRRLVAFLGTPAPQMRGARTGLVGCNPETPHQLRELEVFGLALQPAALGEVIGQHELQIPQVIQNITEKETVSVQKEAALAVPG